MYLPDHHAPLKKRILRANNAQLKNLGKRL